MPTLPENTPTTRLVWDPASHSFKAEPATRAGGKTFNKGPLPLAWKGVARRSGHLVPGRP